MIFEENHLYHVLNRSSAKMRVFITNENYLYFLRKIRNTLLNHCNIVAYCLMPNHFHLLLFVHTPVVTVSSDSASINQKTRSLNQAIGIMLRSYTAALQKQEKFSGSLFQQHTKAFCLTKPDSITPAYFDTAFGVKINFIPTEKQYPQVCFDYIHNNPVVANIASKPEDWEFSSARDYSDMRQGTLVNKKLAEYFGLIYR
jgi:putative transposase